MLTRNKRKNKKDMKEHTKICEVCKKPYKTFYQYQRYCGNREKRIGCAYQVRKDHSCKAYLRPYTKNRMSKIGKEKDFENNIKNNCAFCGVPFNNCWESYQIRGNYCGKCMKSKKTLC